MMKKLFLLPILFMVLFTSCKDNGGDDEPQPDPTQSEKITGKWSLETQTYKGEDKLEYTYTGTYPCSSSGFVSYTEEYTSSYLFDFESNNDLTISYSQYSKELNEENTSTYCHESYNYSDTSYTEKGAWSINEEEETLKFFIGTEKVEAEITSLTESELKLEWHDSGRFYMELEKL